MQDHLKVLNSKNQHSIELDLIDQPRGCHFVKHIQLIMHINHFWESDVLPHGRVADGVASSVINTKAGHHVSSQELSKSF